MASKVDLIRLKEVTNLILDHMINDVGIKSVPIADAKDFYWEVPSQSLYAVHGNQPQLDVGRLTDDWQFLLPVSATNEQAIALMLIHVAPLLRYIGEEVGK